VVGLPDHSAGQIGQALALANELEHGPTLVHALGCAAELHYLRREPQKTEHYASLLLPLVEKHGSPVVLSNAIMLRGWAKVMQGEGQGGIAIMREGITAWRATGSRFRETYRLAQAAEAHLVAKEMEAGLQLV